MAYRPGGRRLRRPPVGASPHQAHRRQRRLWWHPIADWARTHVITTGVAVACVLCVIVGLAVGSLARQDSSAASAITDTFPGSTADPVTDIAAPAPGDATAVPVSAETTGVAALPSTAAPTRQTSGATPTTRTTATTRATATTRTTPVATTRTSVPTHSVAATTPAATVVHSGDPCFTPGATGTDALGSSMVCGTTVTSPTVARWHSA